MNDEPGRFVDGAYGVFDDFRTLWTPGKPATLSWHVIPPPSKTNWSLQLVPIDRGFGRGKPMSLCDEVMASNDGSTAINISTVNDGWYGPTLTYTWTVPQDIELSDPLVRAYLYVNGSKTVDSISTGIVIGDHLAGTNGSNARGLDTKKLDSGSVAGLVFFSTLFLATSALLLFLTSQSMFRTRQRGCSGKVKGKVVVKVEKPDRGFELGAVTKKGYSQVRHKDSGTVQESFAETTL